METKRGRPPKTDEERALERIELRVVTADKVSWQEAADRAGMKLSAWIRDRLEKAAKRESRSGQSSQIADNE